MYMYNLVRTGSCVCDPDWYSSDCSVTSRLPPSTGGIPASGLCDTRYMKCKRVIVYGDNFVPTPNLTCHLQQAKVYNMLMHQYKEKHQCKYKHKGASVFVRLEKRLRRSRR